VGLLVVRRPAAAGEPSHALLIFEVDRAMCQAPTDRRAAEPSTQCIYGNGIISFN
jgi:hypothetical protein